MVNPAISAALLAASQEEESEEFIQKKLRDAKAQGTSGAIALDLNEKQQKFLDQAIEKGTVVKTVDGRFYLNERALADRKEGHGYMAMLILMVIGSAIASIAVLVLRSGG